MGKPSKERRLARRARQRVILRRHRYDDSLSLSCADLEISLTGQIWQAEATSNTSTYTGIWQPITPAIPWIGRADWHSEEPTKR